MMFGVAEDHDSQPDQARHRQAEGARRQVRLASTRCKTGYSAVADEWVGIRPGTDGLFVLALVHELLRTDRIDLDFLVRYTNAHLARDPQSGRRG